MTVHQVYKQLLLQMSVVNVARFYLGNQKKIFLEIKQ